MTQTPLKPKIIYPEPDGEPVAESDSARDYLFYGVGALRHHFKHRQDAYVSGNLWLCYEEKNPKAAVCPDVFVIFGVENYPRSSYYTWENNDKAPDWVLEVTSRKTWKKDENEKPKTYAKMGVTEYFQYDPTGDYLKPKIKGRRLVGNRYEPIPLDRLEDGTLSLTSQVLGLQMQLLPDGRLRFLNPQTGEYLRDFDEAEERGDRQEAEIERLRQMLKELGRDPDSL